MHVKEFHKAIDSALEITFQQPQVPKPSCFGCDQCHCCYEPAFCDDAEADAIIAAIPASELEGVKERAEQWQEKIGPFLHEQQPSAYPYQSAGIACPLLKNGRCLVYASRPMGCRTFFALKPPEFCQMPIRIEQQHAIFPESHAVHDAFLEYAGGKTSMEMDHIGAFLVRRLLGKPEFTTGAHQRIEFQTEK